MGVTRRSALEFWQEKLSRLREKEVFEDDVGRQMKLERDIKEAQTKIAELSSATGPGVHRADRWILLPVILIPLIAFGVFVYPPPNCEPLPTVELQIEGHSLRIDQDEVSAQAFAICMDHPLAQHQGTFLGQITAPAVSVTFADAIEYCRRRGMRLPTAVEYQAVIAKYPIARWPEVSQEDDLVQLAKTDRRGPDLYHLVTGMYEYVMGSDGAHLVVASGTSYTANTNGIDALRLMVSEFSKPPLLPASASGDLATGFRCVD